MVLHINTEYIMTRINTIDPQDLTNEWLLAEARELPRIVNELIKHPARFKLQDIPKQYTLNKGHVTFFRNKLLYLSKRHELLLNELNIRGVNFSKDVVVELDKLSPSIKMFACNDWKPSTRDHAILIERLDERFELRKKSYHKTFAGGKTVINCRISYNEYKTEHLVKYLK
jgi:deoxyribonuclease (pyrimidine dimer)